MNVTRMLPPNHANQQSQIQLDDRPLRLAEQQTQTISRPLSPTVLHQQPAFIIPNHQNLQTDHRLGSMLRQPVLNQQAIVNPGQLSQHSPENRIQPQHTHAQIIHQTVLNAPQHQPETELYHSQPSQDLVEYNALQVNQSLLNSQQPYTIQQGLVSEQSDSLRNQTAPQEHSIPYSSRQLTMQQGSSYLDTDRQRLIDQQQKIMELERQLIASEQRKLQLERE
ncbi:unnamed protein product [Brachionus calyciflorus]|uniref:Uncharacterized protein n=1 Tax=Brachionus calyciflorus TaxID=104777 RepID=A0A814F147_9BILA|nr:unnamed protein product [Brachionus calyciflorus]